MRNIVHIYDALEGKEGVVALVMVLILALTMVTIAYFEYRNRQDKEHARRMEERCTYLEECREKSDRERWKQEKIIEALKNSCAGWIDAIEREKTKALEEQERLKAEARERQAKLEAKIANLETRNEQLLKGEKNGLPLDRACEG